MNPHTLLSLTVLLAVLGFGSNAVGQNPTSPEDAIRALVKANADKDFRALSDIMAHDSDIVGYTIGGRKFVGWDQWSQAMEREFQDADRIEIPIKELRVWTNKDTAWFSMEIDYIRYMGSGPEQTRMVFPLRDTGVLERRNGTWRLVAWHESSSQTDGERLLAAGKAQGIGTSTGKNSPADVTFDLRGQWTIEEEDKSYTATLDQHGNGPYSHKGGLFTTLELKNRTLLGTWSQTGNDREGGFEVLLSEDGNEARGIWWYTRVGTNKNIPPREHGGTYHWKRNTAAP